MKRFEGQQMDLNRISGALIRRILDLSHAAAWAIPGGSAAINREKVESLKNIHIGERCFILANGPSLTSLDLNKLSEEKTFGMNRFYLMFDKLHFLPTYYIAINDLVLRQFAQDLDRLKMQKFLNWNFRGLFKNVENTFFLRFKIGLKDNFEKDLTRSICSGGTVTYAALEVAFYMGFKEVILIGLDHRYQEKGTPNTIKKRLEKNDLSHFHPNYFPQGVQWMLPDLKRSEQAYELARQTYERYGRKIYDATLNGNCTVFSKINYDDLF